MAAPSLDEIKRLARFTIREIVVTGNTLVSTQDLQKAVAPFLGSGRNVDDLSAARKALLDAYAHAGYELLSIDYNVSGSSVGVHRFRVREVRVEHVRVTGTQALTESGVRAQLPSLREDSTPPLGRLARELFLFNDNPGRKADIAYTANSEGKVDAEVRVTEGPQSRTALSYNNTGSAQTGRSRLGLSWGHFNAFGLSHRVGASLGTSLEEPDKVMQASVSYAIPLPAMGDLLSFGAGYSKVRVGTVADLFNVAGGAKTWNLRYTRNLPGAPALRHSLDIGYDERRYEDIIDFFGFNLGNSVTVKPWSLGYRLNFTGSGHALNFGVTHQQNLPGGTRNTDASYAASRVGARANWSTTQFDAQWQAELPADWMLALRGAGQYADTPLIASEQFGLGGAQAVRGLTEREGAGDRGLRTHLEIYTPRFGTTHQLLGFIDAGHTSRLNAQPGERTHESVLSYGLGWRAALGKHTQLTLDVARVKHGTLVSTSGSSRIHATASFTF